MWWGKCYMEDQSSSAAPSCESFVQLGKTWILQRDVAGLWMEHLCLCGYSSVSPKTWFISTTREMNWIITWHGEWMFCFLFYVSPCGMGSGKKRALLIQSSESFMWYCQFLIYSDSGRRNQFWLPVNGFQPRPLQVSHLLFLEEGVRVERLWYCSALQDLVSFNWITTAYGAVSKEGKYCKWDISVKFLKAWNSAKKCNNMKLYIAVFV